MHIPILAARLTFHENFLPFTDFLTLFPAFIFFSFKNKAYEEEVKKLEDDHEKALENLRR